MKRILSKSLFLWVVALGNMVATSSVWAAGELEVPELGDETRETQHRQPATSVTEWLAQIEEALVQITGVQVNSTEQGLDIVLSTNTDALDIPTTATEGNRLTAVIPNAVLVLPDGPEYRQANPAAGIAEINVVPLAGDRVQVEVVGLDGPPTITVQNEGAAFIFAVTAAAPTALEDEEIEITVTAERTESEYLVPDASTATRTDTPLRDIPNSIQVIPRQVIEDQQATGVEEVLENAAGVTFLGNNDGRQLNFSIRGFQNAPVLRDGFVISGFASPAAPEVANLERVEVLRGPASILYGQAEPGGVVNLVTKQPLSEPYYNIQLQGGNREFISPSLDFSGPLTEDGSLLYRLNALYRTEDSFQDYENNFERFSIAPTLTWRISDRTDLTLNLEYIEDNDPYVTGTLAFGDSLADVPLERGFNNPDNTIEKESLNVGYTLEHRFSDSWQLRNQFRYTFGRFDYGVFPLLRSLDESTGVLNRIFANQSDEVDTYTLYTNVQGKFNTGPLEHNLLFGVDLSREESQGVSRLDFNPAFFTPINIFNPDYLAVPTPDLADLPIFPGATSFETTTNRLGIYLQDQIDILDNLILVAGLRYDTVDEERTSIVTGEVTSQYDDALTPRIGIVYQPIEPISLYANYSRSFVPNFATDFDGNFLPPEEGEGFEVGIRGEIIENRLAATLAYFDITKQNVATADPINPFGSVATGEQRSRGIDFNLTGEISPGWNVVASYAYIDAEVTEDNNAEIVGNRLFGIPEHSASLWTTYEGYCRRTPKNGQSEVNLPRKLALSTFQAFRPLLPR